MALEITIANMGQGKSDLSYHNATRFTVEKSKATGKFEVGGYVTSFINEAKYDAGADSLNTLPFTFTLSDEIVELLGVQVYAAIRAKYPQYFSDAINV